MFSGKVVLKNKRDGTISNSTQTCKIKPIEREAYSYAQKLIFWDKKNKTWIVNTYKFSPTTSNHLGYLISGLIKDDRYIRVSAPTFNGASTIKDIKDIESYCTEAGKLLTKKVKNEIEERKDIELKKSRDWDKRKRLEKLLEGKSKTTNRNYFKHLKIEAENKSLQWIHREILDYLLFKNKELLRLVISDKNVKAFLWNELNLCRQSWIGEKYPENFDNLENQNALLTLAKE